MALSRPDSRLLRDGARVGLQAAIAAAAAWWLVSHLLPPHASWAVISAIFVVSQSAGGTLKSALGRAVGTLAGTLIGLACVYLFGGAERTVLRVALAALFGSAMGTLRPGWSFGIVAAVIVALEQGDAVLAGALERALAILIGGAAGVAAAFLVWRERAEKRTVRALSAALEGCRALLEHSLQAVTGHAEDRHPAHQKVLRNLQLAREEASAASHAARGPLQQRVEAIQRLWHALIIIDRAVSEDWPTDAINSSRVREAIAEVKDAAADRLRKLDPAGGNQPASGDNRLSRAVQEAATAASPTGRPGEEKRERIMQGGLAFALVEVERNICELEQLLERQERN